MTYLFATIDARTAQGGRVSQTTSYFSSNAISDAGVRREFIWFVMSEFFVDNEIDYGREAAQISRFPMDVFKEIFFREIAPVCGPNMLTPAPPAWVGFDKDWVVRQVSSLLSTKERSFICRISYEASVLYYRLRLSDV